ncbi:hypothetical protein [Candidatus Poriferisodalis sp.]|uniref:hypothetical protein n=1 Tax=Candidatus Poriferisodalis sp. TaxID=3101277 RepID=UPI003D0C8983
MRWLLDEMLPDAAAEVLRRLGHNAVSVRSISRPHFTAGRWKTQSRGLARNS